MFLELKARLMALNYQVENSDEPLLKMVLYNAKAYILASCNLVVLPFDLEGVCVDLAMVEFLNSRYATGNLEDFDFDSAVKTVSVGDMSVQYMGNDYISAEDRFTNYLDAVQSRGLAVMSRYRSLQW